MHTLLQADGLLVI